jgi:hypothetical protein
MEIAELMTIVRSDYLDDEASGYLWSDAFLLRSFAEAERQACLRSNLIYDDAMITTLAAGTASYTLSSKLTSIERVYLSNGTVCTHKSMESLDYGYPTWRTDTYIGDNAVNFCVKGRKLRLSPSPSVDDVALTLTIEGYRLPLESTVDAGYEPEIPEAYHHDLIYWVLHEAYKKQDADTYGQEKTNDYLNRFNMTFGLPLSAGALANRLEQPKTLSFTPAAYVSHAVEDEDEDW